MVIVRLIGGLGNQMFQYALGRHLAFIHDVPLKLDISGFETYKLQKYALSNYNIVEKFASSNELDQFAGRHIAENNDLPYFNRTIIKEKYFHFDPNILKVPANVYLQEGHWQSEKYFTDIADLIRNEFTLKSELNPIDLEIVNLIESNDAIALHIRRGDYVTNPQTKQFHGTCSLDYYRTSAKLIADRTIKPHFFIFSDDPMWVRDNLKLPYPLTYVSHNGPERNYADLYLMSLCKHQIIANSSFSWWGAWLNSNRNKIVVAPKRWFNMNEHDTRDLLPESWIALSEPIAKRYSALEKKPTVSVVIPCFNQAQFLDEAVESVAAQTFTDWECIVVNDGSPDNTSEVAIKLIERYPDKCIRLLEKQNGGLADARNYGIERARGTYILPLDSDDVLHPEMLKRTVEVLESHLTIAIVYTDLVHFGAVQKHVIAGEYDFQSLKCANQLNYCSLYRREVWEKVGGYNPNMTWGYEDWDFWIGAGERGYAAEHISEALLFYRVRSESMFVKALEHDAELKAQIVLNHPKLYSEQERLWAREILGKFETLSPLVSVIVPTHNRPDMLKDAIQSILDQTFQNFEIIVVNDAGQDVTSVVQAFNSPKTVYLSHETNKGLAAARNTGIRAARGKYIAYLDDDDIFYPEHLETVVTFLQKNGEKVAYTDAVRVHQRIDNDRYVTYKKDIPYSIDFDYDRILYENFIPVLCIVHEKECLDVCGMFDETFCCLEDWELWLRMSRHFTMHHIKLLTCEFSYRPDGSSMSGSLGKLMYMSEQLYEKHQVNSRPEIREMRNDHLQQMMKDRIDRKDRYAVVQIYFDNGDGIRDDDSCNKKIISNSGCQVVNFEICSTNGLSKIRVDPHCDSVILKLESIKIITADREIELIDSGNMINNACLVIDDTYYFETDDPQFIINNLPEDVYNTAKKLIYKAKYISTGIEALHECVLRLTNNDKAMVKAYYDDGTGTYKTISTSKELIVSSDIQFASFDISHIDNISSIRIDPHSDSTVLELESIKIVADKQEIDLVSTGKMINNAFIVEKNTYYFETGEPQFVLCNIAEDIGNGFQSLQFSAKYHSIGKDALHICANKMTQKAECFKKEIVENKLLVSTLNNSIAEQDKVIKFLKKTCEQPKQEYESKRRKPELSSTRPINSIPVMHTQPGKIAIHLHLYYIDLANDLLPFFAQMPFDFDLFITIVDAKQSQLVEQKAVKLCGNHLVNLKIIVVPNRGRDISAFFVGLKSIYQNYDYLCHVHSKKSLYSGKEKLDWCKYLFSSLFKSELHIKKIFGLFETEPRIGQIYSTTFKEMPYWCHSWLSNQKSSKELFKRMGLKSDTSQYIDYPVGSMLWARSKALKPLFDLNLSFNDFLNEPSPNDGSICHAIERSFNIAGYIGGYTFVELDINNDDFTIGEGKKNLWQYWDKNIDRLWKTLEKFKVISFDIFDTIVTRPLLLPDHVFSLIQKRIEQDLNFQIDFLTDRKLGELSVRKNLSSGSDATIGSIYEVFGKITGLDSDSTNRIKQIEIETEINLSIPRKGMIDLVKLLIKEGKQIVFLSDMYLTSDIIHKILQKHGLDPSSIKIMISCESGIRKDSGEIWKQFLNNIGQIHIGDNEHSDIQLAVDNNVPNYHVMSSRRLLELSQPKINLQYPQSLIDSMYLGPVMARLFSSPFELHSSRGHLIISDPKDLGYSVFGPVLLYFMTWLLKKSREFGIQQLLFLAREGYLLQQLFEVLADRFGNNDIKSSYLLCSRRANSVPTLENDVDILELLKEQYTGTLANLLESRYGINLTTSKESSKIDPEILYEKNIKLPQEIDYVSKHVLTFKNTIYAHAKEERKPYLEYLECFGISKGTKAAVVDIGFAGTIQKCLNKMTAMKFPGFYFVTNQKAKLNPFADIMHGCFGNFISNHEKNIILNYSLTLEAVLTAPNGQFERFDRNGKPVFRESAHSEATWPVVRAIQLGVIDYFHDGLNWFGNELLSNLPNVDTATQFFKLMSVHPEMVSPSLRNALRIDDYYVSNGVLNAFHYSTGAIDVATPSANAAFVTNFLSDRPIHENMRFKSQNEFNQYFGTIKYQYEERLLVEKTLSNVSSKTGKLICDSYCNCCGKKTQMNSDWSFSDATLNHKAYIYNHHAYSDWYGKSILFREQLVCGECGLNNRQRGMHYAINTLCYSSNELYACAIGKDEKFNESLIKKNIKLVSAELLNCDSVDGKMFKLVKNGNDYKSILEDNSFNLVVSNDYLNRVSDIEQVLKESSRILKSGGVLLFSIPFNISKTLTTMQAKNILVHSSISGGEAKNYSLITDNTSQIGYDLGWDIIDICKKSNFADAFMFYYYSTNNALFGGGLQFVFAAMV